MTEKGLLRRARKHFAASPGFLMGIGRITCRKGKFQSLGQLKSYHDADTCYHHDSKCYQAEPGVHYRYIGKYLEIEDYTILRIFSEWLRSLPNRPKRAI